MNNSISESKNYFLKIFFLIQFLIVIIKIEATAFSPIYYYEHPTQAQVELVMPDGQPATHSIYNFISSTYKINDLPFSVIDYSALHKYALYYYDNYLITHYRSIKNNFIPQIKSFSVLQRKNPYFQSNDEVPLYLS